MTDSERIAAQIATLQVNLYKALKSEERERFKEIFGKYPDHNYSEEAFAMVARVYCRRAHGYRKDFLQDHEWIAMWHKYEPDVSANSLLETADDYISGGCGMEG